jgi:hypothetical protein
MLDYERYQDAEQANYHFTLSDLTDFIEIYGWDQVVSDLKEYYNKRLYYAQNNKQAD